MNKKFPTLKFITMFTKACTTGPYLSQLNLLYTLTLSFFKVYCYIILLSLPRSPKWSLPISFPPKTFMHLTSPLCMLYALPISYSWSWLPEGEPVMVFRRKQMLLKWKDKWEMALLRSIPNSILNVGRKNEIVQKPAIIQKESRWLSQYSD